MALIQSAEVTVENDEEENVALSLVVPSLQWL